MRHRQHLCGQRRTVWQKNDLAHFLPRCPPLSEPLLPLNDAITIKWFDLTCVKNAQFNGDPPPCRYGRRGRGGVVVGPTTHLHHAGLVDFPAPGRRLCGRESGYQLATRPWARQTPSPGSFWERAREKKRKKDREKNRERGSFICLLVHCACAFIYVSLPVSLIVLYICSSCICSFVRSFNMSFVLLLRFRLLISFTHCQIMIAIFLYNSSSFSCICYSGPGARDHSEQKTKSG
jgi:hypothetical protein